MGGVSCFFLICCYECFATGEKKTEKRKTEIESERKNEKKVICGQRFDCTEIEKEQVSSM